MVYRVMVYRVMVYRVMVYRKGVIARAGRARDAVTWVVVDKILPRDILSIARRDGPPCTLLYQNRGMGGN